MFDLTASNCRIICHLKYSEKNNILFYMGGTFMSTDFYFFWSIQKVILRFDMACIKKPPAHYFKQEVFK